MIKAEKVKVVEERVKMEKLSTSFFLPLPLPLLFLLGFSAFFNIAVG